MKGFWSSFFGTIAGLVVAAALFGLFVVFAIGGLIASSVQNADSAQRLPAGVNSIILQVDLREPRLDQPSANPFAFSPALTHTDLLLALERARGDDRVAGVFVRANAISMAPGRAEEIRAALKRLSEASKPVIVHAQGFEGPAVANYFAVSGADELWLQDTATFSATGYATETVFFGEAIERAGAQAQFLQLYEYKNAADPLVSNDYTEAHREATLSWLGALFDTARNWAVAAVAAGAVVVATTDSLGRVTDALRDEGIAYEVTE